MKLPVQSSLYELIDTKPDIVVFGKDVFTSIATNALKKIIITASQKSTIDEYKGDVQVIQSFDQRFTCDYGGLVGILWHESLRPDSMDDTSSMGYNSTVINEQDDCTIGTSNDTTDDFF
jgi:hypothetical protein